MKVLFVGDLAPTGFGTVTRDLGKAMLGLGMDVRFLSQNDIGKLAEPFLSRTLEAAMFVTNSGGEVEDVTSSLSELIDGRSAAPLANGEMWGEWKPDAMFAVGDFSTARNAFGPYVDALKRLPVYHYCPVEGVNLPPTWKVVWDVFRPIAMCKFGQVEMAKVIGYLPPVMYHGVDPEVFHPATPGNPVLLPKDEGGNWTLGSKDACKAFWQMVFERPVDMSRVNVLRCDRNMPRKLYPLLLRAMAPVMERRPEIDLYIHCRATDQGGHLFDSTAKMPKHIRERVFLTDRPGLSRELLVSLYNAADVYASPSAEGFGLTIAEAIACGVPAVGIDYSSVPEVIGPAGQLAPVDFLYDNPYDHFWAAPDEVMFGRAVEYLVAHPNKRRAMGAEGPKHVRKNFDWVQSARVFKDLLSEPALSMVA